MTIQIIREPQAWHEVTPPGDWAQWAPAGAQGTSKTPQKRRPRTTRARAKLRGPPTSWTRCYRLDRIAADPTAGTADWSSHTHAHQPHHHKKLPQFRSPGRTARGPCGHRRRQRDRGEQ